MKRNGSDQKGNRWSRLLAENNSAEKRDRIQDKQPTSQGRDRKIITKYDRPLKKFLSIEYSAESFCWRKRPPHTFGLLEQKGTPNKEINDFYFSYSTGDLTNIMSFFQRTCRCFYYNGTSTGWNLLSKKSVLMLNSQNIYTEIQNTYFDSLYFLSATTFTEECYKM